MLISLIVCTRNRVAQLKACLEAISSMSKPEGFELVVVDNGSTDSTPQFLMSYVTRACFSISVVREPKAGLARARNAGWRSARGKIVAFTDDDCYVERDFMDNLYALFLTHPELGYMGGRVLLHDPADFPLTIQESRVERRFPPHSFVAAGVIQGANFAFRRAALEQAGGFDPLLGAGTPFPAEDIEMVTRLSSLGWEGIYSPSVVVRHHHGRRCESELQRLESAYDIGRGAYYVASMLFPAIRWAAVKHFVRSVRSRPLRKSFREFWGGALYACHRMAWAVTAKLLRGRG